jgi:hypothetical protein
VCKCVWFSFNAFVEFIVNNLVVLLFSKCVLLEINGHELGLQELTSYQSLVSDESQICTETGFCSNEKTFISSAGKKNYCKLQG